MNATFSNSHEQSIKKVVPNKSKKPCRYIYYSHDIHTISGQHFVYSKWQLINKTIITCIIMEHYFDHWND